jgi:hypothetical protein
MRTVIYNGALIEQLSGMLINLDTDKRVLSVWALESVKGIDFFVRCSCLSREDSCHYCFV